MATWIKKQKDHHLIFYKYELSTRNYSSIDIAQKMDDEEDEKERIMEMLYSNTIYADKCEGVFDQIHVPVGTTIFNFLKAST